MERLPVEEETPVRPGETSERMGAARTRSRRAYGAERREWPPPARRSDPGRLTGSLRATVTLFRFAWCGASC